MQTHRVVTGGYVFIIIKVDSRCKMKMTHILAKLRMSKSWWSQLNDVLI